MNIDIANRLYELRKKTNLSQEELAEKIGVSRQAVSKWERAESAPDTDNLIMLAKLYGVSLDELLFTAEPIEKKEVDETGCISIVPKKGIHVKDSDGSEVHISLDGIEIKEKPRQKKELKEPSYYNKYIKKTLEETTETIRVKLLAALPAPFIITAIYLVLGLMWDLWHPGWLVFLGIPIYYQLLAMLRVKGTRRKLNHFPIALVCVVTYLFIGFVFYVWHPTWIIFLIIPIYYSVVNAVFKN